MSKKKPQDVPMWARTGHGRPVSRRDFLAMGMIPFSASLIAPQWLSLLLPSQAFGQSSANCPTPSTDMPAVMIVNLGGGASLMGNVIPLSPAGQLLSTYSKMGMGRSPRISGEFNNVTFYDQSQILAGIRAATVASTRQKTAFASLCTKSRDDSSENPFAIEGMLSKAGLGGTLLPNLQYNGPYHQYAVFNPPAPLNVSKPSDIVNSLGYAAALGQAMSRPQKESLAKLIKSLSETQARRLASSSAGSQIKDVIECAGIKNIQLNSGTPPGVSLDDSSNEAATVRSVWGIAPGAANADAIYASMAYNALKANAGGATITIGGFDYHDQTRATGNAKDLEAGIVLGRILRTAEVLGRRVFIYVTSDGSVASQESDAGQTPWTSDRGDASGAYILAFDPVGRPNVSGTQIGAYVEGQVADGSHLVGSNAGMVARAAFANYLAFAKKESLFQSSAGGMTDEQMQSIIRIRGL